MNIRLFLSAYRAIHNTRTQYTQEAEEFDRENKIDCPISRSMNRSVALFKIVALGVLMGDFDFLDEFIGNKWVAGAAVITIGVPLMFFIGLMSESEKEVNRGRSLVESDKEFRVQCIRYTKIRRRKRKESKYLHDLGF
ncbi:hypothetical protein CMK19_00705 [Candidatus Poribacteria bacterium]|nr:hypothetical protein [Candidatus Poribacteria bacterium]